MRLNPAAAESQAFLGMALREIRDFDRARQCLQRAMALNPKLPSPYIDLGLVFLQTGRVERALGQLESAMNLPAPAGLVADLDLAVRGLRQAIAAKPGSAEAHNLLGRVLGRQGALAEEVEAEFREAIRLRPDFAEAHNNLGLVLARAGEREKAATAFRKAIQCQPGYADADSAEIHYNLGKVYSAKDNFPPAKREFQEAIRLDPTYADAHNALGFVLEALDDTAWSSGCAIGDYNNDATLIYM